jgi:hypothetical protein
MLRAAAWTFGLFGAGMIVCHLFPVAWLEPVVLLALGFAFLFVSGRIGRVGPRPRRARGVAAKEAVV